MPGYKETAAEVDVYVAQPLLRVGLPDGTNHGKGGRVVDQDVHRPEFPFHRLCHLANLVHVRDVGRDRQYAALLGPDLVCSFLQLVSEDVHQRHI